MNDISKKLEELKNKIEELSKSLKTENTKDTKDTKEVKKLPPGPKPKSSFEPSEHPKKMSQKEAMRMVKEESCEEEKDSEKEEQDSKEVIKFESNGQWKLEKAKDPQINRDWTKTGHKSVFDMSHVNEIAGLKDHAEAKKRVHSIVDSSSAKDETKKKIKGAIDGTKNVKDLASMMSNHILSHQGLNVLGSKKK